MLASGLLDGPAASAPTAQLLTLDAEGDGPVRLELQGLEAELPAALTIMGVLDVLRVPVTGYAAGQLSGPALGVLAACGQRRGYPSAVLGLTEPRLNLGGTATQVRDQEEQVETMVDTLYIRMAEVTGREVDESGPMPGVGRLFDVPEAVAYGLLDGEARPGDQRGGRGLKHKRPLRSPGGFIRANTWLTAPPLLPEIRLYLARDAFGLWERIERDTGQDQLPPPFWAFPWAGGQALARYLLDQPGQRSRPGRAGPGVRVRPGGDRGRRGGRGVGHPERHRPARRRRHHAQRRGEPVQAGAHGRGSPGCRREPERSQGRAGQGRAGQGGPARAGPARAGEPEPARPGPGTVAPVRADVVLAGDAFYDREMAARLLPFLERASQAGAMVLVGDPGRAYLPRDRFTQVAAYDVPVERVIEDAVVKPDHRLAAALSS